MSKITGKQQMMVGKKIRAMKAAGYSNAEIIKALKLGTIEEFLKTDISKKKED